MSSLKEMYIDGEYKMNVGIGSGNLLAVDALLVDAHNLSGKVNI